MLVALLLMATNLFAWEGRFRTSCGKIVSVQMETQNLALVIEGLQEVNALVCGPGAVTITFY